MDAFNAYEVSLGANVGGAAGSGFVLVGAHFFGFELLAKVPWDVPQGVTHTLSATLALNATTTTIDVAVNGVAAASVADAVYVAKIVGGHVGVRAFYSDAVFTALAVAPAADAGR